MPNQTSGAITPIDQATDSDELGAVAQSAGVSVCQAQPILSFVAKQDPTDLLLDRSEEFQRESGTDSILKGAGEAHVADCRKLRSFADLDEALEGARSDAHPVIQLFAHLVEVEPSPPGVEQVPEQISGTSFFPGGTGLWCESQGKLPPLPFEKVMVLGHDFHSVAGYNKSRECGHEDLQSPTWRNLRATLTRTSIGLEDCFFTNVFMGLRQGIATTGPFPGANDAAFTARCQEFFLRQIALQRPRLILALGKYVPSFLAPLSTQLGAWARDETFLWRDAKQTSIQQDVVFDRIANRPCVVASILHPCMRYSNVRHRKWGRFSGDEAEIQQILHAKSLAGL